MKKAVMISGISAGLLFALALNGGAQPPMSPPEKEHEWLKQLTGEWESESEMIAGPGQAAVKAKGAASTKMLGAFWMISNVSGDMMGAKMEAIMTVGYDPKKKKFVGTWVDNMMNLMWKYEGTVDNNGKTLNLEADGPSFDDPNKTAKYRDALSIQTKDHYILTSSVQGSDGKWTTFMTAQFRRKK